MRLSDVNTSNTSSHAAKAALKPAPVDMWVATLSDFTKLTQAQLNTVLSQEEQARAKRFKRLEAMRQYSLSKYLQRHCLSLYVPNAPGQHQFIHSEHGRPSLEGSTLDFNISHAEDFWVCVVSKQCRVGADIEYTPRKNNVTAIAERYFHPRELKALNALQGQAYRERFFTLWTLKEAYLKAKGEGIAYGLDACCFTLEEQQDQTQVTEIIDNKAGGVQSDWLLHGFNPFPHYQAALAVQSVNAISLADIELIALTPAKLSSLQVG